MPPPPNRAPLRTSSGQNSPRTDLYDPDSGLYRFSSAFASSNHSPDSGVGEDLYQDGVRLAAVYQVSALYAPLDGGDAGLQLGDHALLRRAGIDHLLRLRLVHL